MTVLDVYGSLLYAGARTLETRLPDPAGASSPVVVLRLRRRTSLGATFVKVVAAYADRLAKSDGRLYLSGLEPSLTKRLQRTGHLDGPVRTFQATPLVGESTGAAYHDAKEWLVKTSSRDGAASSSLRSLSTFTSRPDSRAADTPWA